MPQTDRAQSRQPRPATPEHEALEEVRAALRAAIGPSGEAETSWIDRLVEVSWHQGQLAKIETGMLGRLGVVEATARCQRRHESADDLSPASVRHPLIARYMERLRHSFNQTIGLLDSLVERGRLPAAPAQPNASEAPSRDKASRARRLDEALAILPAGALRDLHLATDLASKPRRPHLRLVEKS